MEQANPKIYAQLSKVMGDIGAVGKDGRNAQQNYAFRGIEQMYAAVHPAMVKHGVFCAPEVLERDEYRFEKVNYEGKASTWLHVVVKVRHRFYAEDGSYVDVITCGEGLDNSDKATNKSLSGAMKYALIELFCVPTVDVADADRDTPETGTKKKVVIERPVKVPETAAAGTLTPTGTTTSTSTILVNKTTAVGPTQADDDDPFAEKFVTAEQCGKLAKRFRESLKPDLQPMAEVLRHDALRAFGYVDSHGNPSSSIILAKDFITVGKKMVEFAKGL